MNRLIIIIVASCLLSLTQGTLLRSSNKYYPKEFDLSMIPEGRNCEFRAQSEGMCTGGNWAQIFAQALHLSQCIQSFDSYKTLSGEQLLQCTPDFAQDRCSFTVTDLKFVDTIGQFIKNGLASSDCLPFQQQLTAHLEQPLCPSQCVDGSNITNFYAASLRKVETESEVKDQLGQDGPAIVALNYTSGFNQYTSGEYTGIVNEGDEEDEVIFGIRFVLVTGWKTNAQNQTVWKALNSFGQQWANQGKLDLSSSNPYILGTYVMDITQ